MAASVAFAIFTIVVLPIVADDLMRSNEPRRTERKTTGQSPLSFTIRVGWSPSVQGKRLELDLDPADVDALDLPTSVFLGSEGSMEVVSPLTDDDPQRTHCLIGPAEIRETVTAAVVATIPAGICIGKGDLVVPTPDAPDFDTELERVPPVGVGGTSTLTGELVVRFDGCATIDGQRVVWDSFTDVDETGSVTLTAVPTDAGSSISERGARLANGSIVTVETREAIPGLPEWCPGGPALLIEGVA